MTEKPEYVPPHEVVSPKDRWKLTKTLRDGGPGEWSAADGLWDGQPRVALRWNGWPGEEKGNPASHGHPTWFMVPPELGEEIRRLCQAQPMAPEVELRFKIEIYPPRLEQPALGYRAICAQLGRAAHLSGGWNAKTADELVARVANDLATRPWTVGKRVTLCFEAARERAAR